MHPRNNKVASTLSGYPLRRFPACTYGTSLLQATHETNNFSFQNGLILVSPACSSVDLPQNSQRAGELLFSPARSALRAIKSGARNVRSQFAEKYKRVSGNKLERFTVRQSDFKTLLRGFLRENPGATKEQHLKNQINGSAPNIS